VGLWIDHRKAVVVRTADEDEAVLTVRSTVERQPSRFDGVKSTTRYESHSVAADDSRQRRFDGELTDYYDRVIAHLGGATAILILGPGEAKGELAKRLSHDAPRANRSIVVETAGRMTDRQIAARVRDRDASRRRAKEWTR
jgi:hypothetical protein